MPHRFLGIVLLASILVPVAACRPIGPADIPQVKPDGWVVDLAGLLSPEEIAELERLGDAVHQRDGAALAVVTVQSTAGLDPRALATSIFDLWQLGDAKRDNGILIFVAIDDRAAEIVLGAGIDSDAEVAKSDQIMQDRMVPRFRRMEPNLGILSGARACATQFFGVGGPELEALPLPVRAPVARPWRMPSLGVLITLGILALAFAVRQGVLFWQRRPRKCGQCRKSMAFRQVPGDWESCGGEQDDSDAHRDETMKLSPLLGVTRFRQELPRAEECAGRGPLLPCGRSRSGRPLRDLP